MKPNSSAKTLAGNTAALAVLQVLNYIAPLLLIPYLTRVLGVELYGVVAFGLAAVQIGCMVTDYGFNLSATYQIAKSNGNKATINRILSAVMLCKIGLLLLVTLLLAAYIIFDSKYDDYELYFWLLPLAIIGQTFQPIWFFQGIEKMLYITIYTGISRLAHLGAVLVLVSSASDYWWVAVSNGATHILAALIGLAFILKMGYSFALPERDFVRKIFSDSTSFFWSRAAAITYSAGGTFFLGLFSTHVQTALYAAADQLYRGMVSLIVPLHQALYPYMTRTRNIHIFKKILIGASCLALIGLPVGIYISPWVIQVIFGDEFKGVRQVIIFHMIAFSFLIPSSLLGYPFLAALGNPSAANKSVIYAGPIQFFMLLVCFSQDWILAKNVVITVLFAEIFVLSYRGYASWKLANSLKNI